MLPVATTTSEANQCFRTIQSCQWPRSIRGNSSSNVIVEHRIVRAKHINLSNIIRFDKRPCTLIINVVYGNNKSPDINVSICRTTY